jgi:DNA-binding GntR family transcriptional regulator
MAKRGAIKDSVAQGDSRRSLTLKQRALVQIRTDILQGKHEPGKIISATALAQEMREFSKTPIREAMESLAKDGLLDWVGVSGAKVKQFRTEDIYEILRLRSMIETAVAQELCFVKTDRAIEELEELMKKAEELMKEAEDAQPKASQKPDEDRKRAYYNYYEFDVRFHRKLAEHAKMKRAEEYIVNLMAHFRIYAIEHRGRRGEVFLEHSDIFNSIKDFDLDNQTDPLVRAEGLARVRSAVMRHMRGTAYRWAPGIVPMIDAMWEGAPWPEEKKEEKSQPPRDEGSHPIAKAVPKAPRPQ